METVSRILSISPSRQQLKSLISRVHTPVPAFPSALQPHPGLVHAFALLQRLLGYVDVQVIDHTHHFLLECPSQFREMRTPRQLGRLLAAAAMLKRSLNVAIARQPEERHIRIAYTRLNVHFPFGSKHVLGILVIFNSSSLREAFGKTHFASAVQTVVSESKPITLGFVHQASLTEGHVMAYLEFEKEGGRGFTSGDMLLLRARLAEEIKEHIQPLEPRISSQRNEEEVYRNAIILCHELRTINDIPQVMINYEQLHGEDLTFTVLLARPHSIKTPSLQNLWRATYPSLTFVNERTTYLDHFSNDGKKEISIFKLFIPQKNFRCKNCSIDVYAARRFIEQALKEMLGDIRDYNGGLILKQQENRQKFLDLAENPKSRSLMENFFLSIQPQAMQCTLLPELLQSWYKLLKEIISQPIQERKTYSLASHIEEGWLLLSVQLSEASARPLLEEAINELSLATYEKAISWLQDGANCIFSCAYLTYDAVARNAFLIKIERTLKRWESKVLTRQHIRVNFRNLPQSLDPRLTRNDCSISLVRMLFEGLLRKNFDGSLQMALAESVHVSRDGKTYTFTLRKTHWSNGEPLTARDVEYSWKKTLDPRLHSLFAYTFYIIKNARAAHRGNLPTESIGVHAADDRTLVVELEAPSPHFLESTAHWTYSVIPAEIDRENPGWAYEEGQRYICNGPFLLHERRPGQAIVLFKNPYYWDASCIRLEKITVHTVEDPLIERDMFMQGEIDLLAEPMGNIADEELVLGKKESETLPYPLYSVSFLRCNTNRFPFNNQNIRRALQELLWSQSERLAEESGIAWAGPAFSLLPEELSFGSSPSLPPSMKRAHAFLEEGLREISRRKEDIPKIDLIFNTPSLEKLAHAVARLLREALGLPIDVFKNSQTPYFKRLMDGQYHLSLGIWDSWLFDPAYTLDCFKFRGDPSNTSNWEETGFISSLECAANTLDPNVRNYHLRQAENILLEAAPIIPLFQKRGMYCKKKHVHDVVLARNNEIDLKWAYLQ